MNHRSETIKVSDAEVGDSPALPTYFEVVGDLIVGPDGEKRCAQSIVDAQTGHSGSQLFGCPSPVVGHHDSLDQHVEFHLLPALSGLLSDVSDGGVEPFLFPADLVTLSVLKGATEHRQTDDVGMLGRMSEGPLSR